MLRWLSSNSRRSASRSLVLFLWWACLSSFQETRLLVGWHDSHGADACLVYLRSPRRGPAHSCCPCRWDPVFFTPAGDLRFCADGPLRRCRFDCCIELALSVHRSLCRCLGGRLCFFLLSALLVGQLCYHCFVLFDETIALKDLWRVACSVRR